MTEIEKQEVIKNLRKINQNSLIWVVSLICSIIIMIITLSSWISVLFLLIISLLVVFKIKWHSYFELKKVYSIDEKRKEEWENFLDTIFLLKKSNQLTVLHGLKGVSVRQFQLSKPVNQIRLLKENQICSCRLKSNMKGLQIISSTVKLYLLPDYIIIQKGFNFFLMNYNEIGFSSLYIDVVNRKYHPKDSEIVRRTYLHTRVDGNADLRYKNNPSYPVCRYSYLKISTKTIGDIIYYSSNTSLSDKLVSGIINFERFYKSSSNSILETRKRTHIIEQFPIDVVKQTKSTESPNTTSTQAVSLPTQDTYSNNRLLGEVIKNTMVDNTIYGKDTSDSLLEDVIDFIVRSRKASASAIQRKFRIGFNRASQIMDELEERGIVGPANGNCPREVLMTPYERSEYKERHR